MVKNKFTLSCVSLLLLLSGCSSKVDTSSTQIFAMDTIMSISVQGENCGEAVALASQTVYDLEQFLSVTSEESDIWAVNHEAGEWVPLSETTYRLLSEAIDLAQKTDGYFDPTIYPALTAWGFTTGEHRVPHQDELDALIPLVDYTAVELDETTRSVRIPKGMELDMGAIAKGYTADVLAEQLQGMDSALLNLGGNTCAIGTKDSGEPWRIGIQNPDNDGYLAVVSLPEGGSVVTSGGYQRYFEENGTTYWHILDPDTAAPAQTDLRSVSVIGDSGTICDVLSTALFVMGHDTATQFWRERQNFNMVLVDEDGTITITPDLEDNFALADGVTAPVEVIAP